MRLTDDIVYNQVKRNSTGINTFKFLFVPLLLYAICLTMSMFNVSIGEWIRVTVAFVYVIYLTALHKEFTDIRVSLIGEFEKRARDDWNSTSSQELPKNPYLTDGFIYAKTPNEEFPEPFELKYSIRGERCFTMDGYMTDYSSQIIIGDKIYRYNGLGDNFDKFKYNTLLDFENTGHEIVAIKNKYGQYIWIKEEDFKHGKFYRVYKISQIYLLRILLFVSLLIPLIWLLRPIWPYIIHYD